MFIIKNDILCIYLYLIIVADIFYTNTIIRIPHKINYILTHTYSMNIVEFLIVVPTLKYFKSNFYYYKYY